MSEEQKIELTPEQREEMSQFAKDWVEKALEVRPADRARAERGIRAHYRLAKLAEPRKIVWTVSPLAVAVAGPLAAYCLQEGIEVDDLDDDKARKIISEFSWRRVGGHLWAAWPAAYAAYFRDRLNINFAPEALEAAEDVTECGWWWAHKDFALVCDRPVLLKRDEEGRLHCMDGPAIQWEDGWSIYAYHNTQLPKEWVENRETLDPREILKCPDVDQRNAGCEWYGWNALLDKMDFKVIHSDPRPSVGTLIEVDFPDAPGERYVRARCGTGKPVYYKAANDATTTMEALARSYTISVDEYKPERRT